MCLGMPKMELLKKKFNIFVNCRGEILLQIAFGRNSITFGVTTFLGTFRHQVFFSITP